MTTLQVIEQIKKSNEKRDENIKLFNIGENVTEPDTVCNKSYMEQIKIEGQKYNIALLFGVHQSVLLYQKDKEAERDVWYHGLSTYNFQHMLMPFSEHLTLKQLWISRIRAKLKNIMLMNRIGKHTMEFRHLNMEEEYEI